MPKTVSSDVEGDLTRADSALGRVIDAVITRSGRQRIVPSRATPFEALVRAVVYQSISGKAAAVIFSRLRETAGPAVTPAKIAGLSPALIMTAGLSKAKADTIRGVAEWFIVNRQKAAALPNLPDDDVVRVLTGIAGIGTWTVNVVLIFNLGRLDVLPAADLGIRRGVQLMYGLEKVATPKMVNEKAELWRPYRSIASMYLWNAVRLKLGPCDLS
jgi:DNA-3-methyladenine glycosylase II